MQNNIIPYNGINPKIHDTVLLAVGCRIIGDVKIGENSSIWYNSVLRGDVAPIEIGENVNIQDGTIIHTSRFNGGTTIGDNTTVGHSVVIHACTIHDYGFIGMGSIIMDKVIVESYGFVAAGALVSPGKVIKSNELWAGVPAKFIRKITTEEISLINDSYKHYVKLSKEHKKSYGTAFN